MHCSYKKDIVYDNSQMHKQHKHQYYSHNQHFDDSLNKSADNIQQKRSQQQNSFKQSQHQIALSSHRHHQEKQHHQQQQQQMQMQPQEQQQQQQLEEQQKQLQSHQQRKHSHSPHHSRHTSPYSIHSHSLLSSPHQSYQHVNSTTYGIEEISNSPPRTAHSSHCTSIQSSSSHSHSHSHSHHHHHHRRRNRRHYNHHSNGTHRHSHQNPERTAAKYHSINCTRRHRSATDISSAYASTSHDTVTCADREVQEIFVPKTCCNLSRTELAQFFAEDLYGSSRRPSSCCTSSDYCYQTDSTSLYGSRSSLSRNNSVKSTSVVMRKKRALHQRQSNYVSTSLRGLNTTSRPNSRQQVRQGSLSSSSVFDRNRSKLLNIEPIGSIGIGSGKIAAIETQTSKDTLSQDLPDYACSPSPIRWSFLADEKSQSEIDIWRKSDEFQQIESTQKETKQQQHQQQHHHHQHQQQQHQYRQAKSQRSDSINIQKINTTTSQDEGQTKTSNSLRNYPENSFSCDFEESSTTVLFHQEGEAFNNCCNSYIQCNSYLDQDLQITSEDIHQYLSKGSQNSGDILNNSKNYPFQPTNALEFQYKNNFVKNKSEIDVGTGAGAETCVETGLSNICATERGTATMTGESSEKENIHEVNISTKSRQRNNMCTQQSNLTKDTNLNNCWNCESPSNDVHVDQTSHRSTPLPAKNINLSSSSNNTNIIFNMSKARATQSTERNTNEKNFINTIGRNVSVSTEVHHSAYLPYTQSAYDYSNMSSNSSINKTLGIDESPKEFDSLNVRKSFIGGNDQNTVTHTESSSSDGQHSSPLPSPVQKGVSFESFDASSDHNLISQRGSCQFSSPPISPACSSPNASVNPSATSYIYEEVHHDTYNCQNCTQQQQQQQDQKHHRHHNHHHYHHQHQHQHQQHHISPVSTMHHSHCNHGYDCHHQQYVSESFKLSNAFKKVRKRARKYTEFLLKK